MMWSISPPGCGAKAAAGKYPAILSAPLLGEVDFGLSSTIIGTGKELSVKLLPYDLSYFKGFQLISSGLNTSGNMMTANLSFR